MKPTKARKTEITNFALWKRASERVTLDCQLEPLNPTRLSSCVGWDEAALITYTGRRDWLQMHQQKIRDWVKFKPRGEVEIAVCRSLWKSYQFYVTILNSLILHTNQQIKGDILKQSQLFDLKPIREGEIRYVKH